ncbi:hypothetical protein B0O99DRAFT_681800 [Bisporella sp. PMI_857]|nr:hypothetical protein B0O99DRAFT_681800 [Bisporella sp. PMI_857]
MSSTTPPAAYNTAIRRSEPPLPSQSALCQALRQIFRKGAVLPRSRQQMDIEAQTALIYGWCRVHQLSPGALWIALLFVPMLALIIVAAIITGAVVYLDEKKTVRTWRNKEDAGKCGNRGDKALAEPFLPGGPRTYDAGSKRSGVPLTTLYHRAHGRCSNQEKAAGQQYLTPSEEKALEKFLKLISDSEILCE